MFRFFNINIVTKHMTPKDGVARSKHEPLGLE